MLRGSTFVKSATLTVLLSLLATRHAAAQIEVAGLGNEEVYTDRVEFQVVAEPGFEYLVTLNSEEIPAGVDWTVTQANYYQLDVSRTQITTGTEETLALHFIVRDSSRGNSEWGLPPYSTLPPIPSASDEFAGATLQVVAPPSIPAGVPIPIIARVNDADGRRMGVNGTIPLAGFDASPLRLLRGVGSVQLPAAAATTELVHIAGELHGLAIDRQVAVEAAPTWQDVSGSIAADTTWPANSRIRVPSTLTVEAGAELRIGAGTVILLSAGVSIVVDGSLVVDGTTSEPVLFAPLVEGEPWGGLEFWETTSRGEFRGAILTGSGANDDWFDEISGAGSSHRDEQACIYLNAGAEVNLTDCYLIDLAGQGGHGEDSTFTMTRCLLQRMITAGQYNGGNVNVVDSALVEFPSADAPFRDDDNDGLYLTGGAHAITDSLVGWALDDGIDAGSGSGGSVAVTRSWVESCYHEAMAWSRDRATTVVDSVAIDSGQGIECGFDDPTVDVDRCLSTANLVGVRFGDNYDWDYEGFLDVKNSLLLYNLRDVWGRNWDDWTVRLNQMDVQSNWLTRPNENHPNNQIWDPVADAALLVPFLPAAQGRVGVGLAVRQTRLELPDVEDGVPVRLSSFTPQTVTVDYSVTDVAGEIAAGTLQFPAGQTVQRIALPLGEIEPTSWAWVTLTGATSAVVTGVERVAVSSAEPLELISLGSTWRYLDDRTDQRTAWRASDFDDSAWPEGPAELGFGDGDEATEIDGGPSDDRTPTFYFRREFTVVDDPSTFQELEIQLRRDDGAIVYINGDEVFRSNMPAGEVSFDDFADGTTSDEDDFRTQVLSPSVLVRGRNVIAVEVHQADETSSDISFELQLVATPTPPPLPGSGLFIRGDVNGDAAVDIGDPLTGLFSLFLGEAIDCDDALDVDDSGALDINDPVSLLRYLFRSGPPPAAPFPAAGEDTTSDELDCER